MPGVQFATSAFPALVRLGTAGFVGDGVATFKRPQKTLELYEFQACPFCRKARADRLGLSRYLMG